MTVPAPGVAGRYGMRVRTPESPMAFTWGEFARGAAWAWWTFQWTFPLSYPVTTLLMLIGAPPASVESLPSMLGYSLLGIAFSFGYALPWSIGALLLVGGPAAWLLGLSLRRVRAISFHLVCFVLLGLVVGSVTMWVATQTMGIFYDGSAAIVFTVVAAVATGAAVAYGWRRTARRALADDARLARYVAATEGVSE